jgi:hypothetical protein
MSIMDSFKEALARKLVDNSLNSCSRWAENKVRMGNPYPGPMNFDRFPWEPEILDSMAPQVTVRKGAQLGFSVAGLVKTLYHVSERKTDVLVVLPTAKLAGDFAKSRLDQLTLGSPEIRDLFPGASNVGLKCTADGVNLFIRGAVSESSLISVPVGVVVLDEFDRMPKDVLPLVAERMVAYENPHLFVLSTPTLPSFGIDKQYMLGDQSHYFFKCPSCSRSIELDWEDSIEICGEAASDPDCHKSFLKCPRCNRELPHDLKKDWLAMAHWEPTVQVQDHRSFHINQMYAPRLTPGKLVVKYFKGQVDDAAQVQWMNQGLGLPHLLEGAQLTDQIIDMCLATHRTDGERPQDSSRQIVMGVDIGTFLDIVIAEYYYDAEPGYEPHINSICKVLWTGRFSGSDFPVLDRLMAEWQVKYACLDFQPETVNAKAFCRRFHKFASLVQYRKGTSAHEIKEALDDDRVSILTVDRTSFFDMALGRIHRQRTLLPQNLSPAFREHVQNLVRTYEIDEFGKPKATYVSLSADHQAHALLLTEVAHLKTYTNTTGRSIKPGETTRNM